MTDEETKRKDKKWSSKSKKTIEELDCFDNIFMKVALKGNVKAVKLILRIVMNRSDLVIDNLVTQDDMANLFGRSLCLDVRCKDEQGKEYNIEFQGDDDGANIKRARYHSSIMDANVTEPGDSFENLPETYVIFITRNDVVGKGLPLYHIGSWNYSTIEPFEDERHIIYVNGKNQDINTDLGKLMHDFSCHKSDNMYFSEIAERVHYLKETKGGQKVMSDTLKEMLNEAREEGAEEAVAQNRIEVAKKLISMGKLSVSEIVTCSGLPIETVTELANA